MLLNATLIYFKKHIKTNQEDITRQSTIAKESYVPCLSVEVT